MYIIIFVLFTIFYLNFYLYLNDIYILNESYCICTADDFPMSSIKLSTLHLEDEENNPIGMQAKSLTFD